MSLYAKYIQERDGKHIIEDDRGFVVYSFRQDAVYVEDIYILPEFRHSGLAREMTDQVAVIAKEKGLKKLLGSVVVGNSHTEYNLIGYIKYGFKVDSCSNNFILLTKEI